MNVKITREAWIHEAFSVLADGGVDHIKVEALAKRLKVTKGGFYWHFKNRNELLDNMLDQWQRGRVETIHQQVNSDRDAAQILDQLLQLYTDHTNPRGNAIELAVRDWARNSEQAALTVKTVDRDRLQSVAGLFSRLGLEAQEAFSRAYLFYSYVFGQSLLNYDDQPYAESDVKALCKSLLIP
ncbi:MAG: TetR/AcrR family transcriptional regulator [Motiliproteus sp.]|nr:TetR/AcrR family transcriptional regulator [Motiliproteus sp.]MCW9053940.1 TetR/AcrR family transcriptional regulator [Motiliproteus sp.]